MSVDTGPLLIKIAEWAEELEKKFGDTAEIVDAMLIVEVSHRDHDSVPEECRLTDEEDGPNASYSYVDYRVISGRDVVARGLHARLGSILGC